MRQLSKSFTFLSIIIFLLLYDWNMIYVNAFLAVNILCGVALCAIAIDVNSFRIKDIIQ